LANWALHAHRGLIIRPQFLITRRQDMPRSWLVLLGVQPHNLSRDAEPSRPGQLLTMFIDSGVGES